MVNEKWAINDRKRIAQPAALVALGTANSAQVADPVREMSTAVSLATQIPKGARRVRIALLKI